MTAPLTRQDVEWEVGRLLHRLADKEGTVWRGPQQAAAAERAINAAKSFLAAALLAMAECEPCNGTGINTQAFPGQTGYPKCPHWQGTGLNQAVLARGLAALREGT